MCHFFPGTPDVGRGIYVSVLYIVSVLLTLVTRWNPALMPRVAPVSLSSVCGTVLCTSVAN